MMMIRRRYSTLQKPASDQAKQVAKKKKKQTKGNVENKTESSPDETQKKKSTKKNKSSNPSNEDYLLRIKQCTHQRHLIDLRALHSDLLSQGRADHFAAELIQMYARCRSLDDARRVFEVARNPHPRIRQAMLVAFIQNGDLAQAARVFRSMPEDDLKAANTMITAFGRVRAIDRALDLFRSMRRRDEVSWSALLAALTQSGQTSNARKLFNRMPSHGAITATVLLNAVASSGTLLEAWRIFIEMKVRDVFSWGVMITALSRGNHLKQAKEVFDRMPLQSGVCWTSTVTAFAKNGDLQSAKALFDQMPEPDAVTYTSLMTAYAQGGMCPEALQMFKEMDLEGIEADHYTFSITFDACATLSDVASGREVHRCAVEAGLLSDDVVVGNSVLNMYGKCGCVEEAVAIFTNMRRKIVTTWNTLISAYTENGRHRLALQTFGLLNLEGEVEPDQITFTGVFTACSHTGKISHAAGYFLCMRQDFNVEPRADHYVSMSDMLGRVGRLLEGEEVLVNMPFCPESGAWLGLMGSCRTHLNADVAERAAEYVYEADPGCPAPYILLSNIYAAVGRVKDVVRIRRLMKLRGVRNNRAVSFVEVKGRMLPFSVGGWSKSFYKRLCAEGVHGS